MSKAVHRSLEAKLASLQGPEWDSSDEETPMVPLESSRSSNKAVPAKSIKKNKTPKQKKPKQSRVIYLGHLPNNFEEPELMGFLSQFGVVTRLKLSKSRKTCNSRGFCFCEFANSEVAAIVAETMSGYFLQEKRLVCHVVPLEQIRNNLFDGWDRKFTKVDWQAKHREQVNKTKSEKVMNTITKRLLAREKKKKAALKAMGIDYDFPGYEASAAVVQEEAIDKETSGKKKKKRRKESLDAEAKAEEEESPKKKKKRSMSESSDTSTKKKKKSRKDSIDSQGSSSSEKKKKKARKDSIDSHGSSSDKKSSKRKDSLDSQGSSSGGKKKKRRDSVDSTGSSSSKKKSKRKSSEDIQETPKTKSSRKHGAKTEVKKKKAAKHRRAST